MEVKGAPRPLNNQFPLKYSFLSGVMTGRMDLSKSFKFLSFVCESFQVHLGTIGQRSEVNFSRRRIYSFTYLGIVAACSATEVQMRLFFRKASDAFSKLGNVHYLGLIVVFIFAVELHRPFSRTLINPIQVGEPPL